MKRSPEESKAMRSAMREFGDKLGRDLSRDSFRFRVPRKATLEINDPELGRRVYSMDQEGPDLRE
jgi:hypothetical protein